MGSIPDINICKKDRWIQLTLSLLILQWWVPGGTKNTFRVEHVASILDVLNVCIEQQMYVDLDVLLALVTFVSSVSLFLHGMQFHHFLNINNLRVSSWQYPCKHLSSEILRKQCTVLSDCQIGHQDISDRWVQLRDKREIMQYKIHIHDTHLHSAIRHESCPVSTGASCDAAILPLAA